MGEIWVGYGKDMGKKTHGFSFYSTNFVYKAFRQGHQLKNLQNLPFIQIKG